MFLKDYLAAMRESVTDPEKIYGMMAEGLISRECFAEAEEILKGIEDENYKDTAALLLLCDAHEDYSAGRAVYTMQNAKFDRQPAKLTESIRVFEQIM